MSNWVKEGNALLSEIENTIPAVGEVALWFLGQTGFVVKTKDVTILIDPVLDDLHENGVSIRNYPAPFAPEEIKVDWILCTHGHIDHLSKDTVLGVLSTNPEAKVMLPKGVKKLALSYGIPEKNLVTVGAGEVTECGAFSVNSISTAHPVHVTDENDPGMALGYAVQFSGKQLVHLGDTYLTGELYVSLQALGKIDVLMLPINGTDYFRDAMGLIGNISPEEGAKLAGALKVGLAVPTHFDLVKGNTVDPKRFGNAMEWEQIDTPYQVFRPGEWRILP